MSLCLHFKVIEEKGGGVKEQWMGKEKRKQEGEIEEFTFT